jgi:hypothetical protein
MSEIKEISPPSGSIGRDRRVSVGSIIAKCAPAVFLQTFGRNRIGREYTDNRLTKIFAVRPIPKRLRLFEIML